VLVLFLFQHAKFFGAVAIRSYVYSEEAHSFVWFVDFDGVSLGFQVICVELKVGV